VITRISATRNRSRPHAALIVTLGYLAFIGWLTLGPQPTDTETKSLAMVVVDAVNSFGPIHNFTFADLEFISNIAIFVPIGFLFVALFGRRRWWLAILAGAVLTLVIEGTQTFLPARVPDVRDLIANTTGAILGALLALLVTSGRPRASAANIPLSQ
jgi:glycopeptide antibiotics resistance protein